MRNGNLSFVFDKWILEYVLTVPMRNGNDFSYLNTSPFFIRSYRTYEEWKRLCLINRSKSERSSYRTYEEWKRLLIPQHLTFFIFVSSYRTYEEWKLL